MSHICTSPDKQIRECGDRKTAKILILEATGRQATLKLALSSHGLC